MINQSILRKVVNEDVLMLGSFVNCVDRYEFLEANSLTNVIMCVRKWEMNDVITSFKHKTSGTNKNKSSFGLVLR